MCHQLNIACVSVNQTPLDWVKNFAHIKDAIQSAKEQKIEIICFPELSLSGYNCEDMFLAKWVSDKTNELLLECIKLSENITIIIGHPFYLNNELYNCASVLRDKKCHGIVAKQFLANQEIYYEPRWFKPWNKENTEINLNNENVSFGKLTFSQKNFTFGIEICEDAWSESRPGLDFASSKLDIVFNLSASHFSIGKMERRIKLGSDLQNIHPSIVYAYSNLLGNEAGRSIYDGSSYILSDKSLKVGNRFSFKDYELVTQTIFKNNENFQQSKNYQTINIQTLSAETEISPSIINAKSFEKLPISEKKYHEFTLAVSLGIYDYLRKSGSKRIVISLSGGADSTACAILANLGFKLAIKERGLLQVAKDLNLTPSEVESWDFLYCVYQRTENNSSKTEEVAELVARNLSAKFYSTSIDENVELYTKQVQDLLKMELNWKDHDIPLQNIQARTRGPLVWFIANLKNALLISTSNRSEAAVGYTTMDGDTCGGISPIGGIDKTFLIDWLKWLEVSDTEYGNFKFLNALNTLAPTAELKPISSSQTDEKELMPYPILNTIEKLFVRDKLSVAEIMEKTFETHSNFPQKEIEAWVIKFLKLWRANQWKRERYAPSFHLDDESLDPKTWFRYPILSGSLID